LKKSLIKGNLTFSSNLVATIQTSDVLFVCVNTPPREDGSADMSFVEDVSRTIAENLNMYYWSSSNQKRLEEWGEWMREELLLDVPHRQVVFVIPKMLRIFFKYKRRLLGDLCQAAVQALLKYLQAATGTDLRPGIVASIQTFGQKINLHVHLHLLVTEGGEDPDGIFHHLAEFQDGLIAEFFSREVFAVLLGEELISEALVEKIMGWSHSGFSVHSKVRAQTRKEAERVGKYMIRPLLSLSQIRINPESREYYWRKRKEGKSHWQAMNALSRQLIKIIYYMLTNRKCYHRERVVH
jgi:hypothetical protein